MKGWTAAHIDNLKVAKPGPLKLPKVSTNALTQQALKILTMKGYNVWRQNNGAVYDAKIKNYRKGSSTPGISDIIGYHRNTGQFIACEIKNGKDKVSEAQQLFIDGIIKAGGKAIVMRKIEDLEMITK